MIIDDPECSVPVLRDASEGVSELGVAYFSESRFGGADGRSHPRWIDAARFDDVSDVLGEFEGVIHASTIAGDAHSADAT